MYITFYRNQQRPHQMTFEEIYNNFNMTTLEPEPLMTFPRKLTVWNPNFNITNQPIERMKTALRQIEPRVWDMKNLFQLGAEAQYETFYIPKHSGGMRRIDAPKPELMTLLRDIKTIFERNLRFLPHDRAFAYVAHRSTKDTLLEHQKNNSKWFLKLDIKDFFPNTDKELILSTMCKVFPFATLMQDPEIANILTHIVHISLLNGGLPQGTPLSPLLTNLVMIPYDFELYKTLNNFDRQRFIYTRYADDLLISNQYAFDKEKVLDKVKTIIGAFQINENKIRYGSSAGRNWNLGLMLNKDNQITIGYKKKQRFKAALFNFLQDFTNEPRWSILDTQILTGQLAYYQKIEPEYITHLLQKYEQKFNLNFRQCVKTILNPDNNGI